MPRLERRERRFSIALILGLLALVANFTFSSSATPTLIPIGDLFIFTSAMALGLLSGLASLAVGTVAHAVLIDDPLYLGRTFAAVVCLTYFGARFPRTPPAFFLAGLWLLVLGPIYLYAGDTGGAEPIVSRTSIVICGLGEILLAMISGVLLLHPLIWGAITQSSRHVPVTAIIVNAASMVSSLAMFTGMMLVQTEAAGGSSIALFAVLVFVGVSVPLLLAWRLSILVERTSQEQAGLPFLNSTPRPSAFSGLSSSFWRRQREEPVPRLKGLSAADGAAETIPAPLASTSAETGVVVIDRQGTISYFNRQLLRLTGLAEGDHLGKNISSVGLDPAFSKEILAVAERALLGHPALAEIKLNELPNKLRFFEITGRLSENSDDQPASEAPACSIVSVKDVTSRRSIESHLLKAQRLESLGSVVTGIANSFNSYLTAIAGEASLAAKLDDSTKVKEALEKILRSSADAGGLVRELLNYAGDEPADGTVCDLSVLMEQRRTLLQRMAGDSSQITVDVRGGTVPVRGDENLIFQALCNIVMNGCDSYPKRNGTVEISLDTEQIDENAPMLNAGVRPGLFARLKIRDKGCGMNPETLARAFDPLFTTKREQGHTGLGLSTSYAIARALDGFLTAESKLERGTTVTLYLPVCSEQPAPGKSASVEKNGRHVSNGSTQRILVVEDEDTIRDLLASMLRNLGYSVDTAPDSEVALRITADQSFDLILVDRLMPKMGGEELIRELQQRCKGTKTLLMTGNSGGGTQRGAEVLQKPFDIETLGTAVKRSLSVN